MSKQQSKTGTTKRRAIRPGGGHLLSSNELARVLGESPKTIQSWRNANIIPVIDTGFRTKRYSLPAVLAALEKRTIKAK